LVQLPSVDLPISWQSHETAQSGAAFETVTAGNPSVAERAPGGSAGGTRPYLRDSLSPVKIIPIPKDATLTSLAVIHYGHSNPMLLDLILEMNPEITDIDRIYHGQTLRLPEINDSSAILAFSGNSFKIQLGTFTTKNEIMDLQQALHLKNEEIEIVSRRVSPSQWWYRVLVGPYPSKEDCRAALKKLKGSAKFIATGLTHSCEPCSFAGLLTSSHA
ncbi:MAG: SPOR domain-containing protein, partial [Syntrophaceae bacterium]